MCHKRVPVFAGGHAKRHIVAHDRALDAAQINLQRQPFKSGVRHQHVATAAQYKERQVARPGKPYGFPDLILGARLNEVARRASHAKRGERGQRHLFA